MTKEKLIEVLRAEKESLLKMAECFDSPELKENYRGQAFGINSVICMLMAESYFELIAKQHGVELDENC